TTAAAAPGPVSLRLLSGNAGQAGDKIIYEVEGRAVDRAQLGEVLLASLRVGAERSVYVSASPQVSYREVAAAVGAGEGGRCGDDWAGTIVTAGCDPCAGAA